MKKLLLIMLLSCVIATANAQTFTLGNLNYSINNDGNSVTVTGHVDGFNAWGTLNIPASVTYNGRSYTVTNIGYMAFYQCSHLSGSLVIPNSVITIGREAFRQCSGLVSLTIGNHVKTIGESAFRECTGFTGPLTIPNSVETIGKWAFSNCTGFTGSLTIPNSVKEIHHAAFHNCRGMKGSLSIGNSLEKLGSHAFSSCKFTGSLTIPSSIDTIGYLAFAFDDGFTGTLTIPSSIVYIANGAFAWCSGFTEAISLAIDPPVLEPTGPNIAYHVFEDFGCSSITVPCGSQEAYENSSWVTTYGIAGAILTLGFDTIIQYCEDVVESEDNLITVYPNPTNGMVTIVGEDIAYVEVINGFGQTIAKNRCGDSAKVDLSQQPAGVYFLRLFDSSGDYCTKKIMKE